MVREAKQDRDLRLLKFFQPQPQPWHVIFSTSNDSEHLLTISYICFRSEFDVSKHLQMLPQRIYTYPLQWFCQQIINICHLPKSICQLAKILHCYHWYSTKRFPTFQSIRVSRHRYSRPVFQRMFFCFFRQNVSPRGDFGESKGWVLLWKLVGNQSHFPPTKLLK